MESIVPHEFVRPERTDGGHRDRVCVECGLGDTNAVHDVIPDCTPIP